MDSGYSSFHLSGGSAVVGTLVKTHCLEVLFLCPLRQEKTRFYAFRVVMAWSPLSYFRTSKM